MEMTMAVYLFSRAEHAALSQVAAGSMTLPRFLVDDNQPKTDLSACAIAKGKKIKAPNNLSSSGGLLSPQPLYRFGLMQQSWGH